jgi:hypothetical protein
MHKQYSTRADSDNFVPRLFWFQLCFVPLILGRSARWADAWLPWPQLALHFATGANKDDRITLNLTRDQVKAAPEYKISSRG